MSEKSVLFSTSFYGYNKKDVHAFIADENKKFLDKSSAYDEEIKKLKSQLEELEARLSLSGEMLSRAEKSFIEKSEALSATEEELAEAEDKLAKAEASLESFLEMKAAEISEVEAKMRAENEALSEELERLRKELRETNEAYERRACLQEEESRFRSNSFDTVMLRSSDELRERLAISLRALVKNCLREVMHGVNDIRSDVDRLETSADGHGKRINDGIDKFEAQMKDEVRKILDDYKKDNSRRYY